MLQKVKLRPLTVCQENTIVEIDVTYSLVRNVHQVHLLKILCSEENKSISGFPLQLTGHFPFKDPRRSENPSPYVPS